jgi:hypothetical protein
MGPVYELQRESKREAILPAAAAAGSIASLKSPFDRKGPQMILLRAYGRETLAIFEGPLVTPEASTLSTM